MASLIGEYYIACQEVFRASTNQAGLMVTAFGAYAKEKGKLRILSVGSGIGLFEIPMLYDLLENEVAVSKFVGLDIDPKASAVLAKNLQKDFGDALEYEVFAEPYQEFFIDEKFDIILFNHVFEYLQKDHLKWIHKSQKLLAEEGQILIFSPQSDGINKYYAELMPEVDGFTPFFAHDIEKMLADDKIDNESQTIKGVCDVSLLLAQDAEEEQIKLLSFLTQMDCRTLPAEKRAEYIAYYTSLTEEGDNKIPHPTTLFIL